VLLDMRTGREASAHEPTHGVGEPPHRQAAAMRLRDLPSMRESLACRAS
jgi:hypothetical protein